MGSLDHDIRPLPRAVLPQRIVVDSICESLEQLIATLRRYFTLDSWFVPTSELHVVGAVVTFVIHLADGTPALRGTGRVIDLENDEHNAFGTPGTWVGELTPLPGCEWVFEQLTDCPGAYVQLADGTDQVRIDTTPTDRMDALDELEHDVAIARPPAPTLPYGARALCAARSDADHRRDVVIYQPGWRAWLHRTLGWIGAWIRWRRARPGQTAVAASHEPDPSASSSALRDRTYRTRLPALR